ncbi:hypothetical protein V2J09_007422 [Rumex salicifolius]
MGDQRGSSDFTTENVSRMTPVTKSLPANCIPLQDHVVMSRNLAGDASLFILKVVALEMVRRLSMAKCPSVWNGLQGLQLICFPPFKWLQRWVPFKTLGNTMQMLSRPLLVLSVISSFPSLSEHDSAQNSTSNDSDDPTDHPDAESESMSLEYPENTRSGDEASEHPLESWLLNLYQELNDEGITLPERIDEKEIQKFYAAANVKKTIHWRETYHILTVRDLRMWSKVVEFGVLHMINEENQQIMVLVDCEGLSPLKLPLQVMRSCSLLLQDHFPNRLACLFVIRLPPVVRVVAQTFIQALNPVTRQKLKFIGNKHHEYLTEHLQSLPAYLGGNCICTVCCSKQDTQHSPAAEIANISQALAQVSEGVNVSYADPGPDINPDVYPNGEQIVVYMTLKAARFHLRKVQSHNILKERWMNANLNLQSSIHSNLMPEHESQFPGVSFCQSLREEV